MFEIAAVFVQLKHSLCPEADIIIIQTLGQMMLSQHSII